MKERPILFSAPMARAVLREVNPKTQTRRIVKPQPEFLQVYEHKGRVIYDASHRSWCWNGVAHGRYPDEYLPSLAAMNPFGQPGDRLWGRENLRAEELADGRDGVRYPADDEWRPIQNTAAAGEAWHALHNYDAKRRDPGSEVPSIHMPRWACRILLEIEDVRIERLNDCSEADALAEGIITYEPTDEDPAEYAYREGGDIFSSAAEAYRYLWNRINGPGSWAENPWVWAVTFRRLPV